MPDPIKIEDIFLNYKIHDDYFRAHVQNIEWAKSEKDKPANERSSYKKDWAVEDFDKYIEDQNKQTQKHIEAASVAVNLEKCNLPKLVSIRMVKEVRDTYRQVIGDDVDGLFILLGESMQAPGHVIIISCTSRQVYPLFHSENFEIVPPNEC